MFCAKDFPVEWKALTSPLILLGSITSHGNFGVPKQQELAEILSGSHCFALNFINNIY